MDWPAYSPDLNPIEHVWDTLGRRIAERLHHPVNTQQLKQMLVEEWALLPQEILHQLVLSIRRRCEATIAAEQSRLSAARITSSGCNSSFKRRAYLSLSTDIVCFLTQVFGEDLSGFEKSSVRTEDVVTSTALRLGRYVSYCCCKGSELCDLWDDDCAADKSYELRILEGESSSDESDEA
ncbi:transposable element Tc1 transposase [Trichonephila clavipes]|nr:transposable element Tc1 transposase [Trichonephila clavipes]